MNLAKEIKENKWGIILGGVWGLVAFWIVIFSRIDIPKKIWSYILFLPGWLSGYCVMGGYNPLLIIAIAPFTGIAIGYFVSKLVKVIKKRLKI